MLDQRLTADELSKSKWIKSSTKIPTSMLKDLLLRYDSWIEGGGVRASMVEPLAWEQEEQKEYVYYCTSAETIVDIRTACRFRMYP